MDLIFDQYQRYKKAQEMVNLLRPENTKFNILEVGSNEHRNLEKFLPNDRITYMDIKPVDGINGAYNFILGDATNMDLKDNSFDIVIALDVYEHISEERRDVFISELNRVAHRFFIISAPFSSEIVVETEKRVNSFFKSLHGKDHPWLIEHQINGLPNMSAALKLLDRIGINYRVIEHGNISLWEKLMNIHFAETYEESLSSCIKEVYKFYNEFLYEHDYGAETYRKFIISSKNEDVNLNVFNNFDKNANSDYDRHLISNQLDRILLCEIMNYSKNIRKDLVSKERELRDKERECQEKEIECQDKENEFKKIISDKDNHIYNLENKYYIFVWKKIKNFIRKVIRAINRIFRAFRKINIRNIKKGINYYKNNGFKALFLKFLGNNQMINYESWFEKNQPGAKEIELQKHTLFEKSPKISIVVPTYNTPVIFLKEMIESVLQQSYSNWELCIVDGGSNSDIVKETIKEYAIIDKRIKYNFLEQNLGISGNSNEGLKMATGEYIGLLDHDDLLTQNALFEVVRVVNEQHEPEIIYSDEDKTDYRSKSLFDPHFKPDFSPDTLRSYNYICHFLVFKATLLNKVGTFKSEFDGSQDYDLVLRLTEEACNIVHIPKVLYHWRVHENSTSGTMNVKSYALDAGRKALSSHIDRIGLQGMICDGYLPGSYRIEYNIKDNPRVSIIIPNKDEVATLKKCIDSILGKTTYTNYDIIIVENNSTTTDIFEYYEELKLNDRISVITWEQPFNYSAINNFAVNDAIGEYILLLNNDVEIITNRWIEEMLMLAQRDDVGVVGAKLFYPDHTIQHAGVILGLGGVAGHSHKYFSSNDNGYMGRLRIVQNLSAVTAACLMVKKQLYLLVGGLDEGYKVAFNDVDFCIKIRELGKYNVFTPFAELYHYESKSRGYEDTPEKVERFNKEIQRFKEKWGYYIDDPYYSINLTKDREDFSLNNR